MPDQASGKREVELPPEDPGKFQEAQKVIAEAEKTLHFAIGDQEVNLSNRLVDLSPDSLRAIAGRGWYGRGSGREETNLFLIRVLARVVKERPEAERAAALFVLDRISQVPDDNTSGWQDVQRALSEAKAHILETMPPEDLNVVAVEAKTRRVDSARSAQLVAQLKHSDAALREAAAKELGLVGDDSAAPSLVAVLDDPEFGVGYNAAASLVKIGEGAVPALVDALNSESRETRRRAAGALGKIKTPLAVEPLKRLLKEDGQVRVRSAAAEALGLIGGQGVLEELLRAGLDKAGDVRAVAAKGLGNLGHSEAAPQLREWLEKDDSHDVREACATALGALKNLESVNALRTALKDKRHKVRQAAAEALGAIGDKASAKHIRRLLADEEPFPRQAAAHALGAIGDTSDIPRLKALLNDSYTWVGEAAAEAIAEIERREASGAAGAGPAAVTTEPGGEKPEKQLSPEENTAAGIGCLTLPVMLVAIWWKPYGHLGLWKKIGLSVGAAMAAFLLMSVFIAIGGAVAKTRKGRPGTG